MKTINKIAPLALCASVATIVVPITTSCNTKAIPGHCEDLESLYTNGYKRRIEALPSTTVLNDPTTAYLEAINKNPMLLADDVFDYEGNSAIKEKNRIVLRFDEEINAHDSISINKDISQFITEDYETGLEVECLYVSIIEYEDGILWTDPFGIKKF